MSPFFMILKMEYIIIVSVCVRFVNIEQLFPCLSLDI